MFWLGCGPAGTCEPNMRFFKATKAGAATERLDQNFISDMSLATGRQDPFTHESPRANPSKAVVYPRKFQRTPELSAFKLPVVQIVAEWLLLLLSWMYEHVYTHDQQAFSAFLAGRPDEDNATSPESISSSKLFKMYLRPRVPRWALLDPAP
eukprot:s2953_g4.t1